MKVTTGDKLYWCQHTVEDSTWHQVTVAEQEGRKWWIDTPVGRRRVSSGSLFAKPLIFDNVTITKG